MTIQGELLLDAVQARLRKITEANNYPLTVKDVWIHNEITLQLDAMKCPIIEVIQGPEVYEHHVGGAFTKWTELHLRLIASKNNDDKYMERFKSAVCRCMYCDGYDIKGNSGIRLSEGVVMPRMVRTIPDFGVIDANRVYVMVFEIESKTQTWSF
jgi:hypothetical protein